ncbi:protein hypA, putative [Entamoeba invadens IP1]|uniref:Protein hypA, putative n=1 Tax=Entamoeba invadens IP1 TaxID=370355 RepID=A0A0A1UH21_ENTIV|nr:protein hypA, putative [Entamoeba invadens IP1]ELP94435.1 protein hypA, putative [Entamoeba invadens IP1]|eukprot:XP_004261206.1 protein hypA, putative [Entamoeba invadens IP1]
MNKFTEVSRDKLPDYHVEAIVYQHNKTGATVVKMLSKDPNKVFSIAFRTPVTNNKGIAHILEHSTLCGSDAFTTKEPFADLNKGSLKNFLNAFTMPDSTMYPIASTNDKDYQNLMKVYLDAVFFPRVRKDIFPFYQEGWRWEKNEQGELTVNGVVYNEMKNSETSPTSISERKIRKTMFEGTYSHESGGISNAIETLKYEELQEFHKMHYNPTNSITVLYSPMSLLKNEMEILDGYFDQFEKTEPSHVIDESTGVKGQTIEVEYPINQEDPEEGKDVFMYAWRIKDMTEETKFGLGVVGRLLVMTEGSPLSEKIKALGIGKKVSYSFDTDYKSPLFIIVVTDAVSDKFEEFKTVVRSELEKIVNVGFDVTRATSVLNVEEFDLKECAFSNYPKGIIFALEATIGFVHELKDIFTEFRVSGTLKKARQNLHNKFFEQFIQTYLLDNDDFVVSKCAPNKLLLKQMEEEEKERHKVMSSTFTEEKMTEIVNISEELKRQQQAEDTPEQVATIPQLHLSDISREGTDITLEKVDNSVVTYRKLNSTNGILYFDYAFNINDFTLEEVCAANFLAYMMKAFNTEKHTFKMLNALVDINFGALIFSVSTCSNRRIGAPFSETSKANPVFSVSGKMLYNFIEDGVKVIGEILNEIKFEKDVLKKKLDENIATLESTMKSTPFMVMVCRMESYLTSSGVLTDEMRGVNNYRRLVKIRDNFDTEGEAFLNELESVYKKIFCPSRATLYYSCDEEEKDTVLNQINELNAFMRGTPHGTEIVYPAPVARNEALVVPSKVNFVGKGFNFIQMGVEYNAALRVLMEIVEKGYMWDKVRVKMERMVHDPHVYETLDLYDGLIEYLENFNLSEREIETYLIGIFADIDSPLNPSALFETCVFSHMNNTTDNFPETRKQMFEITLEKLKEQAKVIIDGIKKSVVCVIGSEEQIKKREGVFNEIIPVFKTN